VGESREIWWGRGGGKVEKKRDGRGAKYFLRLLHILLDKLVKYGILLSVEKCN
jgi:hypothetical protein